MDLAPEGFVHLPDCFERYCLWLWKDHYPREEMEVESRLASLPGERALLHRFSLDNVTNATMSEIVQLFVSGDLQAIVRSPGQSENFIIPARAWRDAFFPERMFLGEEIRLGHGPHFDAAHGRTPFVSLDALRQVLFKIERNRPHLQSRSALRDALIGFVMDGIMRSKEAESFRGSWGLSPLSSEPSPDEYDPQNLSSWTFAMAVSWISWRDFSHVRDAWDDYRTACWEWFGFRRRLPLRGGQEWYETSGEELRPLSPSSVSLLGLQEALREPGGERQVLSIKSSREELWSELGSGAIVATGLDRRQAITAIRPNEWPYLELASDDNLADYVIQRSRGLEPAYTELSLPKATVLTVWPPEPATQTVVADFNFDLLAPVWTLWEAAIWVGTEGQQRTSREVADGDLDDFGAVALFRLLADGVGLTATGFNQKRVREPIPAGYWELATVDPRLFGKRHYVSFIDEILDEYGGQLTPYGEEAPRWFGIQVKRDDLFSAFPDFAPSVPTATKPTPAAAPRRSPRKLAVARETIRDLYPAGFPKGLSDKERLDAVNEELKKDGHSAISLSTMNRAAKSE